MTIFLAILLCFEAGVGRILSPPFVITVAGVGRILNPPFVITVAGVGRILNPPFVVTGFAQFSVLLE